MSFATMESKEFFLLSNIIFTVFHLSSAQSMLNTSQISNNVFNKDYLDDPEPLEGLNFFIKDDLDPCHTYSKKFKLNSSRFCDFTTTRVFTSRFRFKRFVLLRRLVGIQNQTLKHRGKLKFDRSKRIQRFPRHRDKRNSRTLLAVSSVGFWPRWCRLVAFFRVFKQDFTLCLYKKMFSADPILVNSNEDIGVTIYGANEKGVEEKSFQKLGKRGLSYVSGHVLGKPFSSVHGYVRKNRFYGTIYVKGMILYVEPIVTKNKIRFTMVRNQRKKRSLNAYIYKVYHRAMVQPNEETTQSDEIEEAIEPPRIPMACRSCGLMLVSDFEFFRDVGENSVQKTVHTMLYHVMEANQMLRRQDFNNDRVSDCVGIHVSDIRIVASPSVTFRDKYELEKNKLTNYWTWDTKEGDGPIEPDIGTKSPEDYLKLFSMSHLDGHCLGVLFSNKAFSSRVLGLAWKGDPKKQSGLCQKRRKEVMLKNSKESADLNLNALFVTLRTKSMQRIPLRMGVLNLLHEILHSFGASHDQEDDVQQTEGDNRFLMSRYSNTGIHINHSRLSDKSRLAVQDILENDKMSHCLKTIDKPQLCGDGIVQDGEECDCGSVEKCLSERSCCIQPGGGPRRQEECTFSVPRKLFGKCQNSSLFNFP